MMVTFLPFKLNLTMIILGNTGLLSSKNFAADSLRVNSTSSRCTCCCSVEYPLSSCKCNLFCFILLAEMLYCHISLATWATRLSCRVRAFQVPILVLPFNVTRDVKRLAYRGLAPDGVIQLETSSGVRPAFAEVICIFFCNRAISTVEW